jgi:Mrp family chromosome partitioning ATPase/capsular polysaccharide biosynthesis protein
MGLVETAHERDETAAIREYLRILWQRKWVALIPIVLVPLAALYFSFNQARVYAASAQVTTKTQSNIVDATLGFAQPYIDPNRFLQTQVNLARSPRVAVRAIRRAGVDMSPATFLGNSTVTHSTDSDIITFTYEDTIPGQASRLATSYASAYTAERRANDTQALRRALAEVNRQLDDLGFVRRSSALYDTYISLVNRQQQLQTLARLQGSNAQVIQAAGGAAQIRPRPRRNAALGLGLGIFLGVGLAFLWHAFDTRVRSGDQVMDALGLPLLARVPAPPRRLRRSGNVSMLADPASVQAEAFRVLRTNLEFANLTYGATTMMFTSAVEQEGKSTTAVNVAVAVARAGKRAVLIDLDLRRPVIDRIFGLEDRPGITDVALGHADLDEAITTIALSEGSDEAGEGNGSKALLEGMLEVVTSGPIPPNPGEFMSSDALRKLLEQLRGRADIVLIDTAPILHVGDAMALSSQVEGIVVLARLNVLRRPMLRDLRRILDAAPTPKLGFVLTGAENEAGYEYRRYYRRRGVRRRGRQRVA